MIKSPKRPRDPNQLAKMVIDLSTGLIPEETVKAANTISRGRAGGLAGGKARASSLSPEKRSEIAKRAAAKRWSEDSSH